MGGKTIAGRVCALLCLLAVVIHAGKPVAPAAELPDDWEASVDGLFAEYKNPDEPGGAVGIAIDGEVVYANGFGAANLEYGVPNSPQTLFEIASFSKAFTSLAIAHLMDDGLIDADDDVRKYVPELHEFDSPIRIRHLLTCHSGLWAQVHIMPLAGWGNMPMQSPYSEGDFLAVLSGQRTLPFKPGSEFRYGSSDFFLLGLIVKRATGKSLVEFARERIFEPLGMGHTFYLDDASRVVRNRAVPYHKLPDPRGPWRQWPVIGYVVGGGGVWTNVEDLCRFGEAFEERRLPEGEHVRGFFENGSVVGNRYCLDVDAYLKKVDPELAENDPSGTYRGLERVQFTGGWFGMASAMIRFPGEGVTIVCLANHDDISPWRKAHRMADVILADELQPERASQDPVKESTGDAKLQPEDYAALEGHYRMKENGAVWRLFTQDGLLYYTNHFRDTYELRPIGGNRFEAVDTPYEDDVFVFRRESDVETHSLWLESGGREIGFDRIELVKPSDEELAAYAGEYVCDELLTTYRLEVREESLWLRVNNRRWERLDPTTRDVFVPHLRHPHDGRIFSFERDEDTSVVRLRVDFWRIAGLPFEKRS